MTCPHGSTHNRYSPETLQYRVLLDGFLLIWQVGSKSARERSAEKFLFPQKDGTWRIKVSQANAVPFLREAIRAVLKSKHPDPI